VKNFPMTSMVLVANLMIGCSTAVANCLSYGQSISITGYYGSIVLPGTPNYTSINDGDEVENIPFLFLETPVCTGEDPAGFGESVPSIAMIQLACPSELISLFEESTGTPLTVTGSLFASHTGHHHTAILLSCE